ncbi:MAG: SpoIID/LytB domain-containing protein [Candidatus Eremiobacteraeota bacterium]|nr:SpoIID/LytB domain-containing protein [Candidatus Eremiobacteraeota bacterium]
MRQSDKVLELYARVCERIVRRRYFLTVLGGATLAGAVVQGAAAATQSWNLTAPLRIRLFAGMNIVRLEMNGVSLNAADGTMVAGGRSSAMGSQVIELTGNPYLDVTAFTSAGASIQRRYPGTMFVQVRDGSLFAIDQLDVETYVASVMSAEISPGWAVESLRAQAIAVRTYAARSRLSQRTRDYDLNDDTSSQVYRGIGELPQSLVSAAQDTAKQIVMAGGVPASVFYSSACGGHTASSEELTGQPAPPYLLGVSDLDPTGRAYCLGSPYFRWKNSVTASSMGRIVDVPGERLDSITIAERWPDGRVKTVIAAASSMTVTLGGREFYSRALNTLGYKVIPSALFDISREGPDFAFVGHGVGHGVGMCQWGARGRAEAGVKAADILQSYFPGTTIARI